MPAPTRWQRKWPPELLKASRTPCSSWWTTPSSPWTVEHQRSTCMSTTRTGGGAETHTMTTVRTGQRHRGSQRHFWTAGPTRRSWTSTTTWTTFAMTGQTQRSIRPSYTCARWSPSCSQASPCHCHQEEGHFPWHGRALAWYRATVACAGAGQPHLLSHRAKKRCTAALGAHAVLCRCQFPNQCCSHLSEIVPIKVLTFYNLERILFKAYELLKTKPTSYTAVYVCLSWLSRGRPRRHQQCPGSRERV